MKERRAKRLRALFIGAALALALATLVALLLALPRLLPDDALGRAARNDQGASTTPAPCDPAIDPAGCDDRGAFLDALRVFQRDIQPDLDAISLVVRSR